MHVTGTIGHKKALAWRTLLYVLLALSPFLLRTIQGGLFRWDFMQGLALSLGLTGFAVLMLQPVIAARYRWIESAFGQDRLLRIHRITGITGFLLVLAHPLLLSLARGSFRLIVSLELPWPHLVAKASLLVLALFAIAAVFRAALKIPFQLWFRMHSTMTPLILTGAFIHSFAVAVRYQPLSMKILWVFLFAAGMFSWLHLTVLKRLGGRLRPWLVKDVEKLTRNVWNITLAPPEEGGIQYLPGQFMFVTLLRGRGLPVEEHPFTISSSPRSGSEITFTPKESGDFTATMGKTEKGDRASLMAPFGRFSHLLQPAGRSLVFIAGGIGITPFMSMLRHMRDTGEDRNVLLIYANRTAGDIAFREELEEISREADNPDLEIVHVLSAADESWKGRRGYVNRALLEEYASDVKDCVYFLCGPPPMMKAVNDALDEMGIPGDRIRSERFSF